MPPIVTIPHPAPVRAVPARSTNERLLHATIETPVRMEEGDPAEFGASFDIGGATLRERGGRLWRRMTGMQNARMRGGDFEEGFDPGRFLAYLGSRTRQENSDVGRALGQSPVILKHALPLGPTRRVIEDGRDQAQADLRRFLSDNVVIVEDQVWMKAEGPLTAHSSFARDGVYHVCPSPRGYGWRPEDPNGRVDRVDELWAFTQKRLAFSFPAFGGPSSVVDGVPEGIGAFMDDADVHMFANALPTEILLAIGRLPPAERLPPGNHEAAALLDRFRSWEMRGLSNSLDLDEAVPVMDAFVALRRAAPSIFFAPGTQTPRLMLNHHYMDEVARPRILSRTMDQAMGDDAEALATLSP